MEEPEGVFDILQRIRHLTWLVKEKAENEAQELKGRVAEHQRCLNAQPMKICRTLTYGMGTSRWIFWKILNPGNSLALRA